VKFKIKIKNKKLIIVFCAIFILIVGNIFLNMSDASDKKIVETTTQTAQVSNQTIISTLTAPGEVQSATMEKLTLNTSYSYLTMCVETYESVKEGANLLKYTNGKYLTAPYDCVVISYSVPTVNESCTSSNYIYIASTDDLYMDINIGEDQIGNISVGQSVDIVANYDESKTYTGTITKINAIGTHSSSGTSFAAIASIKNDGTLKLGMSATCTITIEKNENLPCLPIEAIQIENNERYVNLVKENGDTEKVVVETGKSNANYVEIVSGLSLNDTVSYETTVTITNSSDDEDSTKNIFSSLMSTPDDKSSEKSSGRDLKKGGF
jgi:multidrug efflux pump subunit AcrA (membrane-fusion protein)